MKEKPFVQMGLYIREHREKSKATLKQTAAALGMTNTQQLSAIENGTVLMKTKYHAAFCKMCNLKLDNFSHMIDTLREQRRLELE